MTDKPGKAFLSCLQACVSCTAFMMHLAQASPEVSLSGFATLGLTYNDSDLLGYRNTLKQESDTGWGLQPDSLIGLQANAVFSPEWDLVIQGVVQDRVSDHSQDSIEWAFLRYKPSRNHAFRLGRINPDIYLLSEYMKVRYAYAWARPPTEQYSLVSSISNIDGIDYKLSRDLGEGHLESSLSLGTTTQVINAGGQEVEVEVKDLMVLSLSYSNLNWLIRGALVRLRITDIEFRFQALLDELEKVPQAAWPQAPVFRDYFNPNGKESTYAGLGFQYEGSLFQFHSEIGYSLSEWGALPQETTSGYVSLGIHREHLTYYTVLSAIDTHQGLIEVVPGVSTPALDQLYSLGTEGQARMEQATVSLGVKWDFRNNMNLKLQFDHSNVDGAGAKLWTREQPVNDRQKVNLLSMSLNLVF